MGDTLLLENDNRLRVIGLRDDEGNLISAADIKVVEIVRACGEPLVGAGFPIPLVFEEPGQFSGIIPHTLEASRGEHEALILITAAGLTARIYKRLVAIKRVQ